MIDARVVTGQSSNLTRQGNGYDGISNYLTFIVNEEAVSQTDAFLDPAGAVLIEPDAVMLRLKLLSISHEFHSLLHAA